MSEVRGWCALGIGVPTVAGLPPYNEHLMRDVGEPYTALGVVLIAYLVATGGHLVFHAAHADDGTRVGATLLLSGLSVLVALAAVLLVATAGWTRRSSAPGARRSDVRAGAGPDRRSRR